MKILLEHNSFPALILPRLLGHKAITGVLIGVFLLTTTACNGNNNQPTSPPAEEDAEEEVIEERLILENATLNQVDEEGNNLWQLQVNRVVYRQDDQDAELETVSGEFYQDGEVFLQIEANQGRIINDGEQVNLEGEVVATDPRNEAVLKSEVIQWLPQENLLIIPEKMTGDHPRFNASANEGKYYTDREELELTGNVKGTSEDPPLNLEGEQFNWFVAEDRVKSNKPLQVERYDPETEEISDRVTANSGSVNLTQRIVSLENNVEFNATDPPLEAKSNAVTWNIERNLVSSTQRLQLLHREDRMRLSGNQGEINLDTEIAEFEGNVRGVSEANQAKLSANRLTWNLPTQEMEAQGNVVYEQNDPPITSRGEQASGNLSKENMSVRGRQGEQVRTDFVP
ncbi:LPS export ABC transporter periplasmic protein LptC [Euhalothece natronophila Z-M001]|uniref:LPS export ABC transporter periplasmic protein LptC n=1 Tax=Euhalothece natronophila Z-M001 TaxID=522448 RepID=A0A5B8NNH2_9CHRO|nr:LPS export ABC transporter periplasmic protein LptC [Euhalothece natronophila]QDZ40802.1 LPS export ABC transporter periplasmic protein LptC [Euhalothece natronophila Z-M001]